jgi:carbon monoxide dehydrogenase subunit G
MEITQHFEVAQDIDAVWQMFNDVPEVVTCMPGVELTEAVDAETYRGRMKVRLGPMQPFFEGEAKVVHDDANRSGSILARGVDRKGGSRAEAQVTYTLAATERGTAVDLRADITLLGQLAQFGRTGLLRDVTAQMTAEFAACLTRKLEAATPEEAAQVTAPEVRPVVLLRRTVWLRLVALARTGARLAAEIAGRLRERLGRKP